MLRMKYDPEESITLPNRTVEKVVLHDGNLDNSFIINSEKSFVEPIIFVGLTALSVEIRVKLLTLSFTASLHSNSVP